jgi:N-acetylmuramoyl-L-alanine amidase
MTHPYEARLIHTEAYRNAVTNGIAEAVERYRAAVTKKPVTKP